MPNTRNQFRYWTPTIFIVAISVIAAASPVDAAQYDIVVESKKTKIRIGGYDYSLEGRLFRPEGEGRFPLVVLAHGTCGKRCRRRYEESRLSSPAKVFARSGYVAYTFNRIGYGNSDGFEWDDNRPLSWHGGCNEQDYTRAARRSGLQIRLVIESLRGEKYVDTGKILAVGQSGGGLGVFGLTEGPKPHEHLAGLKGVISTAGALGGSCARGDYLGPHFFNENMVEMYKTFGRGIQNAGSDGLCEKRPPNSQGRIMARRVQRERSQGQAGRPARSRLLTEASTWVFLQVMVDGSMETPFQRVSLIARPARTELTPDAANASMTPEIPLPARRSSRRIRPLSL